MVDNCTAHQAIGWVCRYEVDKLSSSQRLDLNLEKGRMRDELQALRDKSNEMEIKMDRSAAMHACPVSGLGLP